MIKFGGQYVPESLSVGKSNAYPWFDIEVIGGNNTITNSTANQVITYSSNPTGVTAGFIYYNTIDNHFYGYNGTIWKQLDNYI